MASDGKRVVVESEADTSVLAGLRERAAKIKWKRREPITPVMIGLDPASGEDRSCLSIQSADLGTPDMVIVNGRRYVPAEEG